MWLTDLDLDSFWPGFWVNVITLPLAIFVTLLGIWATRKWQRRDEDRKRRRRLAALLRLAGLELKRNLKHICEVRKQGGLGPLIAGAEAWNVVRVELVSLSDPSDERFEKLLSAVTEAHSWCASTVGIMDLNLQAANRRIEHGDSLKQWLNCNVNKTERLLNDAIQLIDELGVELAG